LNNLISFDLYSDFGFFRKPDINKIGLTYNIPPKPALLGLLGSILGMSGINKHYELKEEQKKVKNQEIKDSFPEYYTELKHLKIGIEPSEEFPFNKIINTYNSRNSYFSNKNENTIINEQVLIKPRYTIYVYDNLKDNIIAELTKRLKNNNPIFIPYLGKNEFIACFENVKSFYNIKSIKDIPNHISTIFLLTKIKQEKKEPQSRGGPNPDTSPGYYFFEDYPIEYDDDNMHYKLQTLMYSKNSSSLIDLEKGELFDIGDKVIYLF